MVEFGGDSSSPTLMNRIFEFDLYKTPDSSRNQTQGSPTSPRKILNLRNLRELIKIKKSNTLDNLKRGICKHHGKKFEVICMKEKIRICTDCAIFGKHKKHNFISFEEAVRKEEKGLNLIMTSALDLRRECCELLDARDSPDSHDKNLENSMEEILIEKKEEVFTQFRIKFSVNLFFF